MGCFLSLAEDRGMSQTFPPPTLRFVGSDVNTVCSSAPVPVGAIWERGLLRSKKVPIKPLTMTHCIPAGASHVGRSICTINTCLLLFS